ncbi:hypothetical protein K438DRAFT_1974612 [Mycena galopus ATCC 62051]|nr:hypothetical protein K438DRAFT_1974612 [Mycena galopus ATCC 62051]
MPRGRPRLAPEVKQQHVGSSRKLNVDKRREAARLRMRRKRAEISDDLYLKHAARHKAALVSARYRERKQQRERAEQKATHAGKRRASKDEAEDLRRKHQATTSQAQDPAHSRRAPARKKAQATTSQPQDPATASRLLSAPSTARQEDRPQSLARPGLPTTHRRHAESPRRLSDIAQEDDENFSEDSERDASSESRRRAHQSPPPIFEHHVTQDVRRCPHCFQEGCPGCACMCEESTIWVEHEGGHFLPTCKKCGEDDCPGCACVCSKATDWIEHGKPGHENKTVHDASPCARYYAIVSGKAGVMVTSEEGMAREVNRDPNVRTFSASTWIEIMDLWNEDCALNHEHGSQRLPVVDLITPDSSPLRSPPPVGRTPSPSKACAKPLTTNEVAAKFKEFAAAPTKLKTRRTPSPTKAAAKPHDTDEVAAQFSAGYAAHDTASQPLLLYGVMGHNRLFRSRERAIMVLKATPGADLIFAHDEAGVDEFIRAEGVRMMKSSS